MERKHLEDNQEGGNVEQVVASLEGLYGTDLVRLQQVEEVVNRMSELYGIEALSTLQEWRKQYAMNDMDTFKEIAGYVSQIAESFGADCLGKFCRLGVEAWPRLSFRQFRLAITVLSAKGEADAFALVKIFMANRLKEEDDEYVMRFALQFGSKVAADVFSVYHERAPQDYLDLTYRFLCGGYDAIGLGFLNGCVSNGLTVEEATKLFTKLMILLNNANPDIEGCKTLLGNIGWDDSEDGPVTLH